MPYLCILKSFPVAQQGRMDEEVQGVLLQILRMTQQGHWTLKRLKVLLQVTGQHKAAPVQQPVGPVS